MAPIAPAPLQELPLVLDVAQTARVFGVSEWTVRDLIKRGELDHVRLGRLIRIPRHALVKFMGADVPTAP